MMKIIMKKHSIFIAFVWITVWSSLASTPLNEYFQPPVMLSRVYSLLIYLPFVGIIAVKFLQDVKRLWGFRGKLPQKDTLIRFGVDIIYYVFAIYYAFMTLYRLFVDMEAKESLYYAVVFLGSVALYLQIRDHRLQFDMDGFRVNFTAILIYTIVYKILFTMLSVDMFGMPRVLGNPPINNLYTTSVLVMLMPFVVDCVKGGESTKLYRTILCYVLVLGFICESRLIFVLMLVVFGVLFLLHIRNHRVLMNMVTAFGCAVLLVGVMVACDMGDVREALYRETGFVVSDLGLTHGETVDMLQSNDSTQYNTQTDATEQTESANAENAYNQIKKSDRMRSDLMKKGIAQVKKNPLFGTGDLYYPYDLGYMVLDQTSHNFVLETVVSFGLVGLLMIVLMLSFILIGCGLLKPLKSMTWKIAASAVVVMGYYFGMGMLQPAVYNTLLCPLFALTLAYYGESISKVSLDKRSVDSETM